MESVHKGHRQRMRKKFKEHGARVFDTYELLEMLLYNTVSVKDTNPLAKSLLLKFGSLDGVFNASKEELLSVEGIGNVTADIIITVAKTLDICYDTAQLPTVSYDTYGGFGHYITSYFEGRENFSVVLFSLDNGLRLIAADELYSFDYSSGGIKTRPFIDALVNRGASVAVIAHNHPYGPLCPTEGDRQTNRVVEDALNSIGVVLLEHYVVCGGRFVGFMNHLSHAFAQKPALNKFYESKRSFENERF